MRGWRVHSDGMVERIRYYIVLFAAQRWRSLTRLVDYFIDSFDACSPVCPSIMTIVVAQYSVGRRTANSFASECSSYFSMQAWRSSPFLQSAISTAGLVVFSFQPVQAHSSLPGALVNAILLPTVCSTLRGNRSLSLF